MTFINRLHGYKISFKNSALKKLAKIDKESVIVINKKLDLLVKGIQGLNVKKLVDYQEPTYRLRVGVYRILFEIKDNEVTVLVIDIDHRKNAYK